MASILPRSARAAAGPAHAAQPRVRPAAAFAVVLLAALAINVETTIVNVALPSLNSALGSSTRGLQWIVDAYNLAFAALVLVGGSPRRQGGPPRGADHRSGVVRRDELYCGAVHLDRFIGRCTAGDGGVGSADLSGHSGDHH